VRRSDVGTPFEAPVDDVARLRRCLSDMVSIMALPALWTGREPRLIVSTLIDALLGILPLTFVFVRLNEVDGGSSIDLMRVAGPMESTTQVREAGAMLNAAFGEAFLKWPARARVRMGGADLSVASVRLGVDGEFGIVVAGSESSAVPEQTERLLLEVAANHAVLGLQQAQLLSEQKRVARELDERVAQRTDQLAAANEQLKRSEEDSRLIVDNIPGLIALLSATGEIEVVNRQLFEYFGQTLEELKLWGTSDTIHPEDLPRVLEVFSRSIATGDPYEVLQRFRRWDGVYRWFSNSGSPLRDTTGTIARWCVLLTDVDERKRAEDELRRKEAFLASAQRLSLSGSFSWSLDTNEVTFSEEAYRIFEFERDSPVTLDQIDSRIHPEDRHVLLEKVTAARSVGESQDYQIRLLMSDSSVKYLHTTSSEMQDTSGRRHHIGALQDVTQRRLAEEALNKARSELAHVSRVTALGALTASIAHEINQPLSGIITNAGTCLRMLDGDPPNVDGARETARRTIRDGNRASDVIARLRALFSKREFALESIDLNEATREVIALSLNDLQRNRVIIQSELANDVALVTGDRIQLQQVILNLLRNASDAMADVQERPRHLLIRTECEDNGGVRLTVRDTGVGLGSQNMDKIFDAFFTTKSGGMGIGLSVSRAIIERHHGRLWAEHNDGPGATFAFSIPGCLPILSHH
jgi:PAS domain S-box-containing protein